MIIFLEAQLSIIQTRAAETESVETDPSNPSDNNPPRSGGGGGGSSRGGGGGTPRGGGAGGGGRVNHVGSEQCNLCDESHPSANKSFVMCKRFLEMTPRQRSDLVRRKRKCFQCL